jgi:hypothetical protein
LALKRGGVVLDDAHETKVGLPSAATGGIVSAAP